MEVIKLIIKNNTGYSVKSFAVFSGTLIALFSILVVWTLIFLDFFTAYELSINLTHLAIFIGSIEAIIAVLMGLKVWSEKYEVEHK